MGKRTNQELAEAIAQLLNDDADHVAAIIFNELMEV